MQYWCLAPSLIYYIRCSFFRQTRKINSFLKDASNNISRSLEKKKKTTVFLQNGRHRRRYVMQKNYNLKSFIPWAKIIARKRIHPLMPTSNFPAIPFGCSWKCFWKTLKAMDMVSNNWKWVMRKKYAYKWEMVYKSNLEKRCIPVLKI